MDTAAQPSLCRPCLRLFTESVSVDTVDARSRLSAGNASTGELEAGVLALEFRYAAGAPRDHAAERQARYLLESLGAVELECLDHYAVAPDSPADYLIHLDADVHQLCAFAAYAVPQLRSLGWAVDVDPDYRWQVVSKDVTWFARVEPQEEQPDWFHWQLGVELEGRRIDLLPALVELIDGATSLESLVRPSRRCVALRIDDRRYLPVEVERFRAVIGVLSELYAGRSESTGMVRNDELALLAELGESAPQLTWHGGPEVLDTLRASSLPAPATTLCTVPGVLQATLRPYQHEGLTWLQNLRHHGSGAILADDMGLGKTLQTIAHLVAEHASGRSRLPSLIVAPTSLVGNWKRELRRFAPHLSVVVLHGPRRHTEWAYVRHADVVITTYPLVVRDADRYRDLAFYYVILDEAQTIKNARSQAHRAVCGLSSQYRACLSGTPVENDLGELWSLFEFVMPGMLGSAQQFHRRYRVPIERLGVEDRLERLRDRVAPFVLRRTKDEVARELPPKTEIVRAVDLTGRQRDLYESIRMSAHERVRHAIANNGISSSTIAILDALMKLRQVCCDPRLVSVAAARRVTESAKYELLFELLTHQLSQGRRVLLFSQFTTMLDLIAEGLTRRGRRFLQLTGATRHRQQCVDHFEQGRADVFLISLKAGGTGLNLTSADTVIHYDPWWNPAAQAQATDRAYRIGQTKPVFVYNLIAAGSVEEKMLQLQRRKRRLAESLLATKSAALDEQDVENLFGPLGT